MKELERKYIGCLYYCIDTHFEAIHNLALRLIARKRVVYTTA